MGSIVKVYEDKGLGHFSVYWLGSMLQSESSKSMASFWLSFIKAKMCTGRPVIVIAYRNMVALVYVCFFFPFYYSYVASSILKGDSPKCLMPLQNC